MKFKLVAVIWRDSLFINSGWEDVDAISDEAKYDLTPLTCGILLEENKEYIVLVQSVGPNLEQASNSIKIYKKSIQKRFDVGSIDL